LAFAGVQLGLSLFLECSRPGVYGPEYVAKVKRLQARRAEMPDRPLVVLLGSSRTRLALQAGRLSASPGAGRALVFNFGMAGSGPVLELVYLRRLLAQGFRPDLLLVEVLPPTLFQEGSRCLEESWFHSVELRTAELAWLRRYSCRTRGLLRDWCVSRGLPCTAYRAGLRLYLEGPRRDPDPFAAMDGYGWQPQVVRATPAERARWVGVICSQYDGILRTGRLAAQPVRAVMDLLDLCRRRGIPVALVLLPESSEFRTLYSPEVTASLSAFLDGLRRSRNVPVIDARTWAEDADFWDAHHLLPAGAAGFTRRFGREVLRPLIRALPRPG
jgi:hypothetical protein